MREAEVMIQLDSASFVRNVFSQGSARAEFTHHNPLQRETQSLRVLSEMFFRPQLPESANQNSHQREFL